jgi:hypothetical protein
MTVDADPNVGVGTPIVGGAPGTGFTSLQGLPETYLNLEYYSKWLGIAENALFGIVRQDDPDLGCADFYWDATDRYQMVKAIQQAENSIETYFGHALMRKWYCQEIYRYVDCNFNLHKGNVIALGDRTEEVVALNVATGVAVQADEYTISATVDFTDCSEVVIYYPGQTRWEIHPSKVVISGTTATITIPRSRLLKPEYLIDFRNDNDRPIYETASYFLPVVDVYRRFPDTVSAVTFIWRRKSCGCRSEASCLHGAPDPGAVVTQQGTGVITDARKGNVQIEPAAFNVLTGEWESQSWSQCFEPDSVAVSYVSGINMDCLNNCPADLDPQLARAIIALAHSNLPKGICNCDNVKRYYEYDAKVPTPDEGPTIFSPFGISRGQNLAWQIVKREKPGFGGLFA